MNFIFRCIDGEVTLNERDHERWKYVFSGLDLDNALRYISENSYRKPWMRKRGWFHQLSGYLAKLEKEGPKGDRTMSDIIITNEKYRRGFKLDAYGDIYSLVAAREYTDKSGETKEAMEWAFPQDKDRNPREKAIPVKIELGTKDQAIKHLRDVLEQLGAELPGPERLPESSDGNRESSDPEYDDIPW